MNRVVLAVPRYDWSTGLSLVAAAMAFATLAAVPFPQNLVLTAAGAAFVIAAVNPPLSLGCLVASVPVQSLGEREVGPYNLTLTKVVLMATAASWAGRMLTRHRPIRLDGIVVAYAVYVLVLALSIANAPDIGSWGVELYRWWSPLLAYVIAINVLRNVRQVRPIVVGSALGVISVSVLGIVQSAWGIGPEAFAANGTIRAYATFGQPNPFAGYLGLTTPLLVAVAAAWWLPASRSALRGALGPGVVLLCAIAGVVGLVALLLTQSRGGWIGVAAGLLVVAWVLGGRIRWSAVGLGVAALAVIVATPMGAGVAGRLMAGVGITSTGVQVTPENFAVQERLAHWRAGLAMARRYPLLGVGAGNFSDRYREFTPVWRFRISRGHAHNAYIQAAAQSGFVGLAAYLGLVVTVAAQLWRRWRAAVDPAGRAIAGGALGVSVAFAVHGAFDYLHVLSLPVQLVAVWALAAAATRTDEPLAATAAPGGQRGEGDVLRARATS